MRFIWCSAAALLRSLALLCACFPGAQAQSPSALDDVLEKAQAAQAAGQYTYAAALYAHATTLSPGTAELWSNRGVMEYLAGNDQACISSMQRAAQRSPWLFTPALFSGKAYVDMGKPAQALPFLRRAHLLRPADPEVLLTLGQAEASLHETAAAESLYLQAAHVNAGNAKAWYGAGAEALESIEESGSALARIRPASVWSQALLADNLFAQDRPLEAGDTYHAALGGATPAQKAVLDRMLRWTTEHAQDLAMPARSASALATLTSEAEKDAASMSSFCDAQGPGLSAACAFFAGRFEDSARYAAKALTARPGDAEALYWSVKAQERIAVAALSHFEDLSPQSAANNVLVADLYRLQRQPDKALAKYEEALALDPQNRAALQGAILACLATNRADDALSFARTALAAEPSDPQLDLLMAESLELENKHAEEAPYLAKATAVSPELQPRLHYLLGRAAETDGNTLAAVQQFELALPGDKDGSIHYQLSRLYRKRGEVAKAEKALTEAKGLIAQHEVQAATALRDTIAAPHE